MRILAISHYFPHEDDPAYGVFVARQLSEMHRQGADVEVLVPTAFVPRWYLRSRRRYYSGVTSRLISDYHVNCHRVDYLHVPRLSFEPVNAWIAYQALRPRATRLQCQGKFDITLGWQFGIESDVAQRLSRDFGVPAAGVAVGTDVNVVPHTSERQYRRFVRRVNSLDAIIAAGVGVASQIQKVGQRSPCLLGGLVDLSRFQPARDKNLIRQQLGISDNRRVVLFVGHMIRSKGVFELLDAFNSIHKRHDDAMLVFCGDGSDRAEVSRTARHLDLSSCVRLLGTVSPDGVAKWMQASDLFVLPSYREGMPNVVMEAMACGLPVVATDVGGLPAELSNCDGAVLIPPRKVDPLSEAMSGILGDQQKHQAMALASRIHANDHFSVVSNTRRVLAYLEDVLARQ